MKKSILCYKRPSIRFTEMWLEGTKWSKYEFIRKNLHVKIIMLILSLAQFVQLRKYQLRKSHLYLSELWLNKHLEAKDKGNCTHPRGEFCLLRNILLLETAQSYTQLLTVLTCVIGFTPNSRSHWHCTLPALPREQSS